MIIVYCIANNTGVYILYHVVHLLINIVSLTQLREQVSIMQPFHHRGTTTPTDMYNTTSILTTTCISVPRCFFCFKG